MAAPCWPTEEVRAARLVIAVLVRPDGSRCGPSTGPCGLTYANHTPQGWCNAHHVAFATAPSWDAPFKRIGTAPAWVNQTEDPGIFRDKRGNFHVLGHWFHNGKGGHAFSRDGEAPPSVGLMRKSGASDARAASHCGRAGLNWTFAGDAYDGELKWDDGTHDSLGEHDRFSNGSTGYVLTPLALSCRAAGAAAGADGGRPAGGAVHGRVDGPAGGHGAHVHAGPGHRHGPVNAWCYQQQTTTNR